MQDLSTTLAELPIPHSPDLIPGWEAFRSTAVGLAKQFEAEVGGIFDNISTKLDIIQRDTDVATQQFKTALQLVQELTTQRDAALAEVKRLKG